MGSVVDLSFWNPYYFSLFFTVFLSLASITLSQNLNEQLRTSLLFTYWWDLTFFFFKSCGIPSFMIFLKHDVIHFVPVSFSSLITSTGKSSDPLAIICGHFLRLCLNFFFCDVFNWPLSRWFLVFRRVSNYYFHLFLMYLSLLRILSSLSFMIVRRSSLYFC